MTAEGISTTIPEAQSDSSSLVRHPALLIVSSRQGSAATTQVDASKGSVGGKR